MSVYYVSMAQDEGEKKYSFLSAYELDQSPQRVGLIFPLQEGWGHILWWEINYPKMLTDLNSSGYTSLIIRSPYKYNHCFLIIAHRFKRDNINCGVKII